MSICNLLKEVYDMYKPLIVRIGQFGTLMVFGCLATKSLFILGQMLVSISRMFSGFDFGDDNHMFGSS